MEGVVIPDNLRHFLAKWEAAVCEIRAENKACENNMYISQLCYRLETSMVAYSKGNVEFAHFSI